MRGGWTGVWLCVVVSSAAAADGKFREAPWGKNFLPLNHSADPAFAPKYHRMDPDNGLLTVMVAIFPTDSELGYLRNQLRTFKHFFNASSVAEYLLVAPDALLDKLHDFIWKTQQELGLPEGMLRGVPESACAPELTSESRYVREKRFPGWIIQQLLKLACARVVASPFYLVLDTDVFYVRPGTAADLFMLSECGSHNPVCDAAGKRAIQSRNNAYPIFQRAEEQKYWLRNTAETLQLSVPINWRLAIGVTPQTLATQVSQQLGRWLQERFMVSSWTAFLLDALSRTKAHESLDEIRGAGLPGFPPWTEYSLYWVYAVHADVWDDFHSISHQPLMAERGPVWNAHQFPGWEPCRDVFDQSSAAHSGWFSLVQSTTQAGPDAVWGKIAPCLAMEAASTPVAAPMDEPRSDAAAAAYLE